MLPFIANTHNKGRGGPMTLSRDSARTPGGRLPAISRNVPKILHPSDTRELGQIQVDHFLRALPLPYTVTSNFEGLALKLQRGAGTVDIQCRNLTAPLLRTFPTESLKKWPGRPPPPPYIDSRRQN